MATAARITLAYTAGALVPLLIVSASMTLLRDSSGPVDAIDRRFVSMVLWAVASGSVGFYGIIRCCDDLFSAVRPAGRINVALWTGLLTLPLLPITIQGVTGLLEVAWPNASPSTEWQYAVLTLVSMLHVGLMFGGVYPFFNRSVFMLPRSTRAFVGLVFLVALAAWLKRPDWLLPAIFGHSLYSVLKRRKLLRDQPIT